MWKWQEKMHADLVPPVYKEAENPEPAQVDWTGDWINGPVIPRRSHSAVEKARIVLALAITFGVLGWIIIAW
jgi:hypothetical protein